MAMSNIVWQETRQEYSDDFECWLMKCIQSYRWLFSEDVYLTIPHENSEYIIDAGVGKRF